MSRKKSHSLNKLLAVAAVLIVIGYVGYQAYRSIFSDVKTELASQYSVYESVEATGLILRSETLIPANQGGHIYYTVQNGARVAKNGVIASVYSSENDGQLADRIKEIDTRLAALRAIQGTDASAHVSLDIIETQLNDALNMFIADVGDGMFSPTTDVKTQLLSLLSKKQLVAGKPVNFSAEITKLEQEKKELQSQYRAALSVISAPVAGYFVDSADGYESVLSAVDPLSLTVDRVQELLNAEAQTPPSCAGKIVGGYEWYFACVVPDSYYNVLTVDSTLSLKMDFVSDEEVPVTVAACHKGSDGQLAVVLRCAYMSEALSDIRKETAQLLLVRHSGLKVPKRAIVIDDEMQAGVYVRAGNVVAFRKIKQLYSEPADYVICEMTEERGYLHLYDDIIVSGKGLYDGKSIH